jgi:hypothetical protein
LFRYRFIKNFRYAEKLYENNRRQTEALQRSSAKSGTKNLKSSNLPAGRQVGKDRFRELAEGGSGRKSACPTNFGRNLFEFFRTHTTNWKMRHFAPSLASIHPLAYGF